MKCYTMEGSCGDMYGILHTTTEKVLFAIVNIVIIFVASLLNISIIVLIKTRRVLHQPSFILLAALACSDLAMMCLSGTMYLAIALRGVSKDGKLEMATCYITISIAVNVLLLLCSITHDRYQCIKHSMDNGPYTTKRTVALKIMLCIIASFIFSSIFIIESEYKFPLRAVELFAIIVSGGMLYINIYYAKLSRIVRRNQVTSFPLGPNASVSKLVRRVSSPRSNLNKSILLLVAAFVVSIIPFGVTTAIRNILYRLNIPPSKSLMTATLWFSTLSFSNSAINPLIYTYRSDAVGRELRKVYRRFRRSIMADDIALPGFPPAVRNDND